MSSAVQGCGHWHSIAPALWETSRLSFIFLEEEGKDKGGGERGRIWLMEVKPCPGVGDVPGLPCVLPQLPSHPPNVAGGNTELGDTGERSW